MMNITPKKLQDHFQMAVGESLEGMAFMEFDASELLNKIPAHFHPSCCAQIHLLDPLDAQLILMGKRRFVKETVESIIGDELTDNEETLMNDTMGEIVNTIGGRFLALITPAGNEFKMGLPKIQLINSINDFPAVSEKSFIYSFKFMENELIAILAL
jgi:hypothetical protein